MLGQLLAAVRTLQQGLVQLVYPGTCWGCGQSLALDEVDFCAACRLALTSDPHNTCPRCAATVGPFVHLKGGCTACRGRAFAFEQAVRLGSYQENPKLREAILRLKRPPGEGLAEVLGGLWAEQRETALRSLQADVIVPVPLHWWRRWRRGYNQSEVLAQRLANRLGLPVQSGWLRRTRHTPFQNAANRMTNVRGALRASSRARLKGRTVLVVDDVFTSGSTLNEAARALRAGGAARVVAAVLARA